MIRQALAIASALAFVLAPTARAQSCGSGETFIKNDVLPAIPGQQAVSVIAGLCEGEAAGAVFNVSGPVQLRSAAIGFVNAFGFNGAQAVVNLVIYDGITFHPTTGIPTLGPEVFDFAAFTGASIGLQSSAINTVDLSQFDIPIASGKLVMTWWMDINPNGDCSTGFDSNFATDNPTGPPNCNVTQKNLIYILGQGWRDAATAAIGPISLCPLYYAGNWLMRGCVAPDGPIQPFCAGDGTLATACPCNNFGAGGQGCENSPGTGGAYLSATGNPVPDTVVMTSAGELNTSLSIFWQGSTELAAGAFWGDGVRCVSGTLKRLYTKGASGGVATAPTGAELSITARSAQLNHPIAPGSTRYYQVAYRDGSQTWCPLPTGSAFNASNGLKITW
ncbi:MAG: hypothetical protein ACKVXR_09500 [Planctomycetota bacterium]